MSQLKPDLYIGIVYKIIHKTDNSVPIYIGSTTEPLSRRWAKHRYVFNQLLSGKKNLRMSVHQYFEIYGFDSFVIVELERYIIADRRILLEHEQLWMDKLRAGIYSTAGVIPVICNDRNSFGLDKGKGVIRRQRYLQTDTYKAFVDRTRFKITCECGSIVARYYIGMHRKSTKHKQIMNTLSNRAFSEANEGVDVPSNNSLSNDHERGHIIVEIYKG